MLLIRNFDAPPMMLPEDARIRQEMRKAERGSFSTVAASDGIERVYAYHKLENLPLYANFGTPTRIVLVDWLRRAAPVWVMLGALSGLLLLAAIGFLVRSQRGWWRGASAGEQAAGSVLAAVAFFSIDRFLHLAETRSWGWPFSLSVSLVLASMVNGIAGVLMGWWLEPQERFPTPARGRRRIS